MTERLPLWMVTGFLGSGKTTLLRSLIRVPELGRLAVVINEFGETGLDHDIIEASSDDTFMLEGGCLCCMVRGDLIETLTNLIARHDVGEPPYFDGVVVETSGLADPYPVIDMLSATRLFTNFYHFRSVITVIDALNARRVLAAEELARAQLSAADHIVLAKTDLCSEAEYVDLVSELSNRAPGTPIHTIVAGAMEAIRNLSPMLIRGEAKISNGDAESLRAARHDLARVSAHTVNLPTPLGLDKLDACLSLLTSLAGPQLLRAKGLIVLPLPSKPVVIQAVQEMVYRPMPLARRPEKLLRSRLVLITRNIDSEAINNLLAARNLPRLNRGDQNVH